MRIGTRLCSVLPFLIFLSLASFSKAENPWIQHVVIVGIDGLTPRGILQAKTPNMHQMMRNGAFTLHAHAILPTVSLPNWGSLFMGAGRGQHGIKSNSWKPSPVMDPRCVTIEDTFPTIFGVLREQRPDLIRAVFYKWSGIALLLERSVPDEIRECKNEDDTVRCAVDSFQKNRPNLTFMHLDHVDHAGHESGYDSKEYLKAVEKADRLVGEILIGLQKANMTNSTAILVTSDHGGLGRKHGRNSLEEVEIPWILYGAGVAHGKEICTAVNIYDTAPTIAHIFGVTAPSCWIGTPILEALMEP